MSCAVETCVASRHQGHLMCRSHWYRVPKPLRDEVWRTWKAFTRTPIRGREGAERRALVLAYRDASNAAVESVTDA